MVAAFSIFATLSLAAILIDATIVRGVLLPAMMKLLGERNWYPPAGSSGSRASSPRSRPRPGSEAGSLRRSPIKRNAAALQPVPAPPGQCGHSGGAQRLQETELVRGRVLVSSQIRGAVPTSSFASDRSGSLPPAGAGIRAQ
jgi:hypothetical protein